MHVQYMISNILYGVTVTMKLATCNNEASKNYY